MRIAFPCPESVRLAFTADGALGSEGNAVTTTIDGGLISFEIQAESLADRLAAIRELDEACGLAIADADDNQLRHALTELKRLYAQLHTTVLRESSYSIAASERLAGQVEKATDDSSLSHLRAKQHASSESSSEQHGVAPQNEENENVEARKEEQQPVAAAGRRGRRSRG